jgi:hypothetical protein
MDRALVIEEVRGEIRERIGRSRRKAEEDQFEIVLVGEFQGGKSTTFNALCDGRAISPRGMGIKTSACRLSAQNLADRGAPERAVITWRTKRDIVLMAGDIAVTHLAIKYPERFGPISTPEALAERLDMDSRDDRALLLEALHEEWNLYGRDKAYYMRDERGQERMDMLQSATLAVAHYGSAGWKRLVSRAELPVVDVGPLIAFPTDWTERWNNHGFDTPAQAIPVEMSAFVFIARILSHLHSESLARLGCRITDCPGIFASAWDTKVATEAMYEADAIWYLLNGARDIGAGDLKVIRWICDSSWRDKLWFSVNMRGNTRAIIEQKIRPAQHQKLSQNGIPLHPDDLHLYHAALALRATQGDSLLKGQATEHDKKELCKEAEQGGSDHSTPAEAWQGLVIDYLFGLKVPERSKVNGLNAPSIAIVREQGLLDALLSDIENTVVSRKARSILITQGGQAVRAAIMQFEGFLQAREQVAEQTLAEHEQQRKAAAERLGDFLSHAKEDLEEFDNESIDQLLFTDCWKQVFLPGALQACDAIARRYNREIEPELYISKASKSIAVKKTVSEELKKSISAKMMAWIGGIRKGQNECYQREITRRVKRTCQLLNERWGRAVKDDQLLEGISLRLDNFEEVSLSSGMSDEIFLCMSEKLGVTVVDILGDIVCALVWGLLLLLVSPLLIAGWVFRQCAELCGGATHDTEVMSKNEEEDKTEEKKNVKAKAEELRKALEEKLPTFRDSVSGKVQKEFSGIRYGLKESFNNELKRVQEEFESRVKEKEALFKQSHADRERVAAESHKLRTGIILPLRREVEQFCAAVEPLLPKPS